MANKLRLIDLMQLTAFLQSYNHVVGYYNAIMLSYIRPRIVNYFLCWNCWWL